MPNIVKSATIATTPFVGNGVGVSTTNWLVQFDNTWTYVPKNNNLVLIVGGSFGTRGNTAPPGTLGPGWDLVQLTPPNYASNYEYIYLLWKIWGSTSSSIGEIAMDSSNGRLQYSIFEISNFNPDNPIPQFMCLSGGTVSGPVVTTPGIVPGALGMLPIFVVQQLGNTSSPAGPPSWAGATLDGYSYTVGTDATPSYLSTAHGSLTTDTVTSLTAACTLDSNNSALTVIDTIVFLIGNGAPPAPIVHAPITGINNRVPTFGAQVYRNGNWVDLRIRSASGRVDKGKAGSLTLILDDNPNDQYRSHLYENEKVRFYRGKVGMPNVRSWTGFVDAPTITDEGEISRSVVVTDNLQELNTSLLLDGQVFDNLDPMYVCASVVQSAIDTFQFIPTDDAGNPLSGATASFSNPSGNKICYFPELYNLDGSLFMLASGELGSYTSGNWAYASGMIPLASVGQNYLTYTLPNQYLIASMTQIIGWSTAASNVIPPASGSVVIDYYNGVLYFNNADQGKAFYASSTFYQAPNWSFAPGSTAFDIISEIMDKSGCRWGVDGYGKFWAKFIDATVAPKRIFDRASYVNLSIQLNRDRRNVIVVEGWNPTLSQLIVAMAINTTDINSAPPVGLGKRQYMIIQDQSWINQDVVNQAAYYAAQHAGRRGKIKSVKIIDDPTISVEDCVGFIPPFAEVTPGDLFYVDSMEWQYSVPEGGGMSAQNTLSGGSIPGQGLLYINALTANSKFGSTSTNSTVQGFAIQNLQPVVSCSLSPAGGSYYSTFSIAGGLTLTYTIDSQYNNLVTPDGHGGYILSHGSGMLEIYGSDDSYQKFTGIPNTNGTNSYNVPMGGMNPNIFYVFKMTYNDCWTNVSYYRDFITALP